MEHDLNWQIDWVPRQEAGSWKRRHECRYWLASYFPLKCSFNLRRYSQARYMNPNIGIPGGCWLRSCMNKRLIWVEGDDFTGWCCSHCTWGITAVVRA